MRKMIFCYVSARFKITRSCLNNVMKNANFQFGTIFSGAKYAFFSASENQIVEKKCISNRNSYAEPGGGCSPFCCQDLGYGDARLLWSC